MLLLLFDVISSNIKAKSVLKFIMDLGSNQACSSEAKPFLAWDDDVRCNRNLNVISEELCLFVVYFIRFVL